MRRSAAAALLRPFPLVSLVLAILLTIADLATGATGGVLLLAAFVGACGLAVGDRIGRAADEAAAGPALGGHGAAAGDGGIDAGLSVMSAARKEAK